MLLLILLLSRCGSDDCDGLRDTFGSNSNEYRQCVQSGGGGAGYGRVGGGSYGGFSTGGGGHK